MFAVGAPTGTRTQTVPGLSGFSSCQLEYRGPHWQIVVLAARQLSRYEYPRRESNPQKPAPEAGAYANSATWT